MRQGTEQFPATELAARDGITTVLSRLENEGLASEHLGSVEIVLSEVVNNVVEHAYAGVSDGEVHVSFALSQNALNLTICDKGAAFPNNRLPVGKLPDLDVALDDLPEGGFGWNLIRRLTSELTYKRHEGCNQLDLSFEC